MIALEAGDHWNFECPMCGFKEDLVGNCCTMTAYEVKTSKQEIKAYQSLYGDLVQCVDHYRIGLMR